MTALVADPVCKVHDTGRGHPETARRFDAVLDALESSGLAGKMRRTLGIRLTGDPAKAVESVSVKFLMTEPERAGVLRHLIEGGDLSAYGVVNAVTHFSQEVDDYDRATDFEVIGGKLVNFSAAEWAPIAAAA